MKSVDSPEGHWFDNLAEAAATRLTRRKLLGGLFGASFLAIARAGNASAKPTRPVTLLASSHDVASGPCKVQYPVKNLSNCPNKRPHPGVVPTVNGCGPAGILNLPIWAIIPNSFMGADFTSACNTHDECYGTCGSSKSQCDSALGDSMRQICHGQFAVELGDPTVPAYYEVRWDFGACDAVADIYQSAVSNHGQGAFDSAQKEACECCFPQIYCNCNKTCYTDVNTCLANCQVTLGCFTAICGPATAGQC